MGGSGPGDLLECRLLQCLSFVVPKVLGTVLPKGWAAGLSGRVPPEKTDAKVRASPDRQTLPGGEGDNDGHRPSGRWVTSDLNLGHRVDRLWGDLKDRAERFELPESLRQLFACLPNGSGIAAAVSARPTQCWGPGAGSVPGEGRRAGTMSTQGRRTPLSDAGHHPGQSGVAPNRRGHIAGESAYRGHGLGVSLLGGD